jgi:hypothetical protein
MLKWRMPKWKDRAIAAIRAAGIPIVRVAGASTPKN